MIRTLIIQAVMNGFVVNVGCQSLVFETRETLLSELARYLKDPTFVEKEYATKALNAKHTLTTFEDAPRLRGIPQEAGPRVAVRIGKAEEPKTYPTNPVPPLAGNALFCSDSAALPTPEKEANLRTTTS